ncbi:protealysin inhibitor emfourin [Nocardioides ferulae]|uniref:protealysin inhibitor emfourin n=1 Tax=Nocardioides ferulae TaxID=2340821 RepID=UPI000EB22D58|nr:protealysin inhibitor emfourin [Nocardioides ferulae]
MTSRTGCSFVPPYLLRHLAEAEAAATLAVDEGFRASRASRAARAGVRGGTPTPPAERQAGAWTVHTADNTETLPGRAVRATGEPDVGDPAVDEAATGVTAALALFEEVFGRRSYDGAGAPVSVTVHYGRDYANAFWDGTQLVFGDGDGRVFERFTKPVDVLGHELAHGVVEHTAGLVYSHQSGALNESLCDVFAACLKQRLRGQTAAQADWLIGEGLFRPGVDARALRDMAAPGTAYDDPALGRDPQPAHLDDYVHTDDDSGGVHLNSGIPNRAFVLAARALGGSSWEGAGAIWYAALTGGRVGPDTGFAGFAAATVAAAGGSAEQVRDAWAEVGVVPDDTPAPPVPAPGGEPRGVVRVRRTGGFAGLVAEGEVDLDTDDPRAPELRALADRVDLAAVTGGTAQPDRFVYTFDVCGHHAVLPEQALTDDLRRLAGLLLDRREGR